MALTFRVSTATILRWQQEALATPERQTVGSLLNPSRPCAATTTRSDTSSRPSHSPASRATARSPRISPARAGSSPAGRFSGSARRSPSCRLLQWRTQGRLVRTRPLPTPRVDAGSDRDPRFPAALLLQARCRPRRLLPNAARRAGLLRRTERPRRRPPVPPPRAVSVRPDTPSPTRARSSRRGLPARPRPARRPPSLRRYRSTGSIAIIERFFRTLKTIARLRSKPPLLRADLERRLAVAFDYYAWLRPHQGLAGATPARSTSARNPSTSTRSRPRAAGAARGPESPLRPSRSATSIPNTTCRTSSARPRRGRPPRRVPESRPTCARIQAPDAACSSQDRHSVPEPT